MVETAAYVLRSLTNHEDRQIAIELAARLQHVQKDASGGFSLAKYSASRGGLKRYQAEMEIQRLMTANYLHESEGGHSSSLHAEEHRCSNCL
jgi:hypothetical protein